MQYLLPTGKTKDKQEENYCKDAWNYIAEYIYVANKKKTVSVSKEFKFIFEYVICSEVKDNNQLIESNYIYTALKFIFIQKICRKVFNLFLIF